MHPVLINSKIEQCDKCKIAPNRGFGWGNIRSKIMFIAQNPGWQPDSRTSDIIPFGLDDGGENSGKWLKKLLNKAKIDETQFYITNVVKCPTPGNRPLTEAEIFNCLRFLRMEIKEQQPVLIFLVGKSSQQVFKDHLNILLKGMRDEYLWFSHEMWHPAYIMRTPSLYKEWKKEFMMFWNEHKHMVLPMLVSAQSFRHAKGYTVGEGYWSGAYYQDIYEATAFQKFLKEKL